MVTTRGMHMKRKANVSSADTEVHIKGGRPGKRLKREGGNLDGEKGTADTTTNGSSLMVKMRKSKRKVQGRLADLMNMPIDIFEEICSHLHPLDLLHLARASKSLRAVLMSKTSRAVWKAARQNQEPDMPDRPDFLSEPQYAALIFTSVCQVCGDTKASRVYYGLYSRYCGRCVGSYVIEVNYSLLGSSKLSGIDRNSFMNILPTVQAYRMGARRWNTRTWCSKQAFGGLSKEWSTLKDELDKAAFITLHTAKVAAVKEHATALKLWRREEDRKKVLAVEDTRKARLETIKERLLTLGWEMNDFPTKEHTPEDREWFKLTAKNQVLTERVWNNIQSKLQNFLAKYRPRRLERERIERIAMRTGVLKQYYLSLRVQHAKQSPNVLFPWGYDLQIEDIAPIKELIDDDDHGAVTKERWEEQVPQVIEFLTQRTSEIDNIVVAWCTASYDQWLKTQSEPSSMLDHVGKMFDSEGHLDLRRATVVFKCSICHDPVWYPACFQHLHCHQWRGWSSVTNSNWKPGSPGPLGLIFDPTLIMTISEILAQLDIDPVTTPSIDLPSPLNPLSSSWERRESYACLLCSEDSRSWNCVPMPRLIEHFRKELADFQGRADAIARLGIKAFSNLDEGQDMPALRNDHDLSMKRGPTALWQQVSWNEITVLRQRNNSFINRIQKYRSPDYQSITGNYFQGQYNHRCLLCPTDCADRYYNFGIMLTHIKAKHEIDLEKELEAKYDELEQAKTMQSELTDGDMMDLDNNVGTVDVVMD
ncbi:hypothetical protein FRC03_009930 [Tulasnella sp. 419]|nr:hypothetical protein FRC03_009930 [Tulasnella sp. 419]